MPNTRYRKGKLYAADMAMYSRQIAADNSQEISRLKRNLIRCLREDVTAKQRQVMLLYYAEGKICGRLGRSWGWTSPPSPAPSNGGAAAPALPALRRGGLSAEYG